MIRLAIERGSLNIRFGIVKRQTRFIGCTDKTFLRCFMEIQCTLSANAHEKRKKKKKKIFTENRRKSSGRNLIEINRNGFKGGGSYRMMTILEQNNNISKL